MRINGLGFYIKNLSDTRKQEHEAQDLLRQKRAEMQQAALQELKEQQAALDEQQKTKLATMQQQQLTDLQTWQELATQRKARLGYDTDTATVSSSASNLLRLAI